MGYAVEAYYKAGAIDKANKLSKDLFAVCEDEFRFFSGVATKSKDSKSYEGDIGRLTSALDMLNNYAATYGQKELETEYSARMVAVGLTPRPAQPQFPEQPQQQMPQNMNMDSLIKAMQALDSANPGAGAPK